MPLLKIETNVTVASTTADEIIASLTESVPKAIGKPSEYFVVQISSGHVMKWNGADDPVAMVTLNSIGGISKDSNAIVSSLVADVLSSKLGVKGNRYYMNFNDYAAHNVGYNSSVF